MAEPRLKHSKTLHVALLPLPPCSIATGLGWEAVGSAEKEQRPLQCFSASTLTWYLPLTLPFGTCPELNFRTI